VVPVFSAKCINEVIQFWHFELCFFIDSGLMPCYNSWHEMLFLENEGTGQSWGECFGRNGSIGC